MRSVALPPAARVTDPHACPAVGPGPHVGGPILPVDSSPNIFINGLPAAIVGTLATCDGPPDAIIHGSSTVFFNGKPAARMGDMTLHGGFIIGGSPNVIIGDAGSGGSGSAGFGMIISGAAASAGFVSLSEIASKTSKQHHKHKHDLAQWREKRKHAITEALKNQHKLLEKRKAALARWDKDTQADVKKWFGSEDDATRKTLQTRVDREIALNEKMTISNFAPADPPDPGTYAYVYPKDATHTIYLDQGFDDAPDVGTDSKAGTLAHEMSHFSDVGATKDIVYGQTKAMALANTNSSAALNNADSFEYFIETAK